MWNSLFFAWFWHDMILHDMILHDMILHGMILRFRCCMLHVFSHDMCMWLNPVPLPLVFFPVRLPYVGSSWRTWRSGGGAVPSGN